MAIVSPENTFMPTECTATLHKLGEQALQTTDIGAHNEAIRTIVRSSFGIVGSFATAECVLCQEEVKIPTYAFIIDPLV